MRSLRAPINYYINNTVSLCAWLSRLCESRKVCRRPVDRIEIRSRAARPVRRRRSESNCTDQPTGEWNALEFPYKWQKPIDLLSWISNELFSFCNVHIKHLENKRIFIKFIIEYLSGFWLPHLSHWIFHRPRTFCWGTVAVWVAPEIPRRLVWRRITLNSCSRAASSRFRRRVIRILSVPWRRRRRCLLSEEL